MEQKSNRATQLLSNKAVEEQNGKINNATERQRNRTKKKQGNMSSEQQKKEHWIIIAT